MRIFLVWLCPALFPVRIEYTDREQECRRSRYATRASFDFLR